MLLDVSTALREPGKEFAFIHPETIPPQDILGETVTFENPVRIDGVFSMTDNTLHMKGKLVAVVHTRCANCLEQVTSTLAIPFDEVFTHQDMREELEDEDQLSFQGSKVEMSHLALMLAVLEMPMRFLCKEDCEGFIQQMPDNQQANACQEELNNEHPFAALQQLLTKDQEV